MEDNFDGMDAFTQARESISSVTAGNRAAVAVQSDLRSWQGMSARAVLKADRAGNCAVTQTDGATQLAGRLPFARTVAPDTPRSKWRNFFQ